MKGNHFVLKTVPVWFARIGCLRRKAAAAAKAVKKASERDAMDDSVEIHAPDDTLQFPSKRSSSDGSSKAKRTKTKATSFWVLGTEVRGFYGGTAQPSRVGPP